MNATLLQNLIAERDKRKRLMAMKDDAERDLLCFVRMMWPIMEPERPLVEGWLLDLLCDVLMAITDGELTRVCINVPPGASKSSLLNVLWPAWEWGPCNRPSLRYLSVSYSTGVPVRDNLRFSRIIKHPIYQACWGDRVRLTREGAEWVGNDRTGFKMVTSTGGGTTGFRGDRILADDLNNPIDVESDTVRATTNKFLREVLPDRVNDLATSAIINLQQRTHREDATGTLIEFGQGYEFVCVPMEFDPLRIGRVTLRRDMNGKPAHVWIDPRSIDENGKQLHGLVRNSRGEPMVVMGSPMAQAAGESCWPERFPEDIIAKLKLEKGQYAFDSQYQQIPGVRGGAVIQRDWWKLWAGEDYPTLGTVVVSVDTAVEEKETNDWNACTAWGAFAGKQGEPLFLLLAAWKVRTTLADLVRMIAETCRERRADYLLIEHKTRGRDVSNEILRLYATATWETVLVKPDGDKISRLKAVSHLFSGDVRKIPDGFDDEGKPRHRLDWFGGVVYAPDKEWADEVITQVADFPYSAHDDYCFVAGTKIATRRGSVPIEEVTTEDEALTPFGWRRVTASGMTGIRPTMTALGLAGTGGHPVFSLDTGWQALGTVTHAFIPSRLSLCGLIRLILLISSSSKVSLIDGWEAPGDITSLSPRPTLGERARRAFMSQSGSQPMGSRFRRALKSTTATMTCLISILTIWSAYRSRSIVRCLGHSALRSRLTWLKSGFSHLLGTSPTRAESGTGTSHLNISTKPGQRRPQPLPDKAVSASGAAPGSCSKAVVRSTADRCASVSTAAIDGENTNSSTLTMRPVYNLTVAEVSCYYANGILVHNCDTVSQALGWCRKHGVVLRKTEFEDDEFERNKFRKPLSLPYSL